MTNRLIVARSDRLENFDDDTVDLQLDRRRIQQLESLALHRFWVAAEICDCATQLRRILLKVDIQCPLATPTPSNANWSASVVLPAPVMPTTSVVLPVSSPPPRMSSRP